MCQIRILRAHSTEQFDRTSIDSSYPNVFVPRGFRAIAVSNPDPNPDHSHNPNR